MDNNIFIITSIAVGILLIVFFVFWILQKKNASDIENGDNSPEESNIELMALSSLAVTYQVVEKKIYQEFTIMSKLNQ